MRRDDKMDVQIGVSKEGYAGRLDVIAGPTGRQQRSDAEKARITDRAGLTVGAFSLYQAGDEGIDLIAPSKAFTGNLVKAGAHAIKLQFTHDL